MANIHWRKKSMPVAEWTALQQDFGELQIATGAPPNLAMFVVSQAGDPEAAVYITGPGIEAIELRSPGGWRDADAPSGRHVTLLVGQADAWNHFGIERPR